MATTARIAADPRYRESEDRLWDSVGLSPAELIVPLRSSGTRARVQEVGTGPAVLFIHGGPNSGSTWAPLLPYLEGFRCLLLDRPGTGLSEPIAWRSATQVAEFADGLVADVLDGLGLERAHVVASSFGGYCALRSAATSPERFDHMVQMACPALLPGQILPPFMKAIMFPGLRKIIAALPPTQRSNESILRQIGHGKSLDAGILPPAHSQWYEALQRYTRTMRNDFDLIRLAGRALEDPRVVLGDQLLGTVDTPTHFIWGADDTFGGPSVAEHTAAVMPHASLEVIEDFGHLPWLDDPALVGAATAAFLAHHA